MESSECETSDSDNHAVHVVERKQSEEREQTLRRLSASIESLKRVCADGDAEDSEDEGAATIPAKKSNLEIANSGRSTGTAGRSILSFFTNKPARSDPAPDLADHDDTQNEDGAAGARSTAAPAVSPGRPAAVPLILPESGKSLEKGSKNMNEGRGTRDYSKNKRVCLLCAKNEDPKIKKKAILSRGGDYQINRHKKSVHSTVALAEVKKNIVPMNHISVPKSVRTRKGLLPTAPIPSQEAQVKEPNVEVTMGNVESSLCSVSSDDNSEEDGDNENDKIETMETSNLQNEKTTCSPSVPSQCTVNATLQTDLSNFVTVSKQTFEEKVITMIEKLSNKVDDLKEASTSRKTAGMYNNL